MAKSACLAWILILGVLSTAGGDPVLTLSEVNAKRAAAEEAKAQPYAITMAPAKWIWMPCDRTLSNTFVLFRKEFDLKTVPKRATGWITADSRYRLTVNGQRVQWGPAPCDPRQLDVDPCDLTPYLRPGKNVLGAEVLFYGLGDGTWPGGKPGFLFQASLEFDQAPAQEIVSDKSWLVTPDRAHRPGQFKRWYLRALQEDFDARLHPFGWDTPGFSPDSAWTAAAEIECAADKPAACGGHESNDLIDRVNPAKASLRTRQIPLLREYEVPAKRLADSGRIQWLRDPRDWFDFRMPDSFKILREPVAAARENAWELPATATDRDGGYATFEFEEQMVGWPSFTIEAPEGAIVELMIQESHDPDRGPAWLDTHFYSWTRFVCREGVNRFETFDYESFRWLQLHVRNASRPVVIRDVGMRRRVYPWPQQPHIACSEPALQRLFDAGINTLNNSAQETYVDGMGRERQQYSGDCGPQIFAVRYALGDTLLARRYLRTFSEGQSPDGYFMDCWPAFDRLARVMQKQMDAASWGPLLDHGVGLNFDCWWHFLETGDLDALKEPYPRLLRFAQYLESIRDSNGLLPVENLGIPAVWIDHNAFRKPRHKQCAFNLYAAAMFRNALAPICRAFNDGARAEHFEKLGDQLLEATAARHWDSDKKIFVANKPWLDEEKGPRYCDRSLATSILYDQCPDGQNAAALKTLVECPPEMGLSYPANAYWRYWALAKLGRTDVILKDFRERWATMPSVVLNKTLQEDWHAEPDSTAEWSHCPLSPVFELFLDIAGIRPTAPGFTQCVVRPQLADLGRLDLTANTIRGPIRFIAEPAPGGHHVSLTLPAGCEGELLLPATTQPSLEALTPDHPLGLKRFRLEAGTACEFDVPRQ